MSKPIRFKMPRSTEETPNYRRNGWLIVLSLAGLIGIVFFISRMFLIQDSLRLDEAQSIWQTSHSLGGTLEIVAQDVHMPMYHILLHYWMILFGTGIETVRTLSFVFFAASIPVVYLLSRMLLSRKWALALTTVFALSPFMNWYANEARMYTLLAFFSFLNQYFFVKILKKKRGWVGYTLSAVIGVYSHYFFVFNLVTQAIFYLFNRKQFPKHSFKKLLFVALGAMASMAPWIIYFVREGLASNTRPLLQSPSSVDFFNIFSQFIFGFQTDPVNTILVSCWPLLVVAAFFTVKRHVKVEPATAYLLVAATVPILIAFVLSFVVTPFFLSRYMVPSLAPLLIIVVWLLSKYSKKVAIVAAIIWAVSTSYLFTLQTISKDNPVREDYKSAAQYIESNASSSDVIALSSPFTIYPFEYYYDGDSQIKTLPIWDRQNPGSIPPFSEDNLVKEVDTLKKGHEHIYLLLSHDQGYEKKIYDYFTNNYERTFKKQYSDDLTLYVYKIGYDPTPVVNPLP